VVQLDKINWKEKEESKEIRRPFTVKVEESTARGFIDAIHSVPGIFVRETMVKLMRAFTEFVKEGGLSDVRQGNVESFREGDGTGSAEGKPDGS
jgi:hypothetical protein